MLKTKHSEGPWELLPLQGSIEPGVLEIGIKTKEYLNHVVIYGDGGLQHQADARLVVKSPEMFELLEQVYSSARTRFGASSLDWDQWIRKVTALVEEISSGQIPE